MHLNSLRGLISREAYIKNNIFVNQEGLIFRAGAAYNQGDFNMGFDGISLMCSISE